MYTSIQIGMELVKLKELQYKNMAREINLFTEQEPVFFNFFNALTEPVYAFVYIDTYCHIVFYMFVCIDIYCFLLSMKPYTIVTVSKV